MLDGFNATVFAYGCTGAGKTYTMIGNGQEGHQGIMVLTLQDLFKQQRRVSGFKPEAVCMAAHHDNVPTYSQNIKYLRETHLTHVSMGRNDRRAKCKAGDIL